MAPALEHVGPVQPGRADADEDLAVGGLGVGSLLDEEVAVADDGRTHGAPAYASRRICPDPPGHVPGMAENLKKGDRVEWNTPQGKTTGTVEEKVTGEKRVGNQGQKGTKVKGSEDDPRYVVESERSGKRAAHKPESLSKKG